MYNNHNSFFFPHLEKDRCKTCHGKKVVRERKILEVHVDRGMRDGQKITFHGEGDQDPNVKPGDIIIILDEQPHTLFKRDGMDLYMVMVSVYKISSFLHE